MKRWMYNFTRKRRVGAAVLVVLLLFSVLTGFSDSRRLSGERADEGVRKFASLSLAAGTDVTSDAGQSSAGDSEQGTSEDAGQDSTENNGQNTTETATPETTEDTKEQYKVTYSKNPPDKASVTGRVEDGNSPYEKDSEVTVLANGVTGDEKNKGFNCNGYTFEKWNTKADGSGTSYLPGETFTITEDITLYAQWQVMITINSFDVSPSKISVSQGENYSFTVVVRGTGNLTQEATWEVLGQNMPGTTIDDKGTLHVDREESAGTITVRATSKDLTDRWATATVSIQELVRYDISYNGTGGTGDMTSHSGRHIAGTKIIVADCEYSRPGYDFVSWNTAVNGNGYTVLPGDEFEMTQDIIMYAQWKRNVNYVEPEPEPVEPEPVIKPAKTDKEYAEEAIALIEAIGEVTAQSLPAIQLARQSYNALTDAQKELIGETQLQKLLLKEQLYREQFAGGSTVIFESTEGVTNPPATVTQRAREPLAKGKKFNADGFRYKVTVSSLKTGTVTVVRPLKQATIKTAVIPAKVTYNDVTYKVTGVSGQAFQKCKKLTKVTIGKNITSLGKELFAKNKKCKTVVIKSGKLKKIASNAFKDLSKKASITMPDKKYRSYETLLKKSKLRSDIRLKTY